MYMAEKHARVTRQHTLDEPFQQKKASLIYKKKEVVVRFVA